MVVHLRLMAMKSKDYLANSSHGAQFGTIKPAHPSKTNPPGSPRHNRRAAGRQ